MAIELIKENCDRLRFNTVARIHQAESSHANALAKI